LQLQLLKMNILRSFDNGVDVERIPVENAANGYNITQPNAS